MMSLDINHKPKKSKKKSNKKSNKKSKKKNIKHIEISKTRKNRIRKNTMNQNKKRMELQNIRRNEPAVYLNIAHGGYDTTSNTYIDVPKGKTVIMLGEVGKSMFLSHLLRMWPCLRKKQCLDDLLKKLKKMGSPFRHITKYEHGDENLLNINLLVSPADTWSAFGLYKLPLKFDDYTKINEEHNLVKLPYLTTMKEFLNNMPNGIFFFFNCRIRDDEKLKHNKPIYDEDEHILAQLAKDLGDTRFPSKDSMSIDGPDDDMDVDESN